MTGAWGKPRPHLLRFPSHIFLQNIQRQVQIHLEFQDNQKAVEEHKARFLNEEMRKFTESAFGNPMIGRRSTGNS